MDNNGNLELSWINKDKSLYFEIDRKESRGKTPIWVPRNSLEVSEPRIFRVRERVGDPDEENMLIKGDNLLSLITLVQIFNVKEPYERVKAIYIDPPFNIGKAFEDYPDNLEHSQWLTMMRDRLILLKNLLRPDGVIFIHINDIEEHYLRVLMDQIFGRSNFINRITVKTKSPSGFKVVNLGVFETAEYILVYGKEKKNVKMKTLYVEDEYDTNYKYLILNKYEDPENWEIVDMQEHLAKEMGFKSKRDARNSVGKSLFKEKIADYALENAQKVFRYTEINEDAGKETLELGEKSLQNNKIYVLNRENHQPRYIQRGHEITFYSKKVKELRGKKVPVTLLTNIWTDIPYEGIAKEGNVKFKQSKKPEALVKRILELSTDPGDVVLDSFLGSGTTAAVAHKMRRKWIGIELGDHAESKCLMRLKSVVLGEDQTGVSKECQWKGGGGFTFYEIGPSILKAEDINWSILYKEIGESVFLNFGYPGIKEILGTEPFFCLSERHREIAICLISKESIIINKEDLDKIIEQIESNYSDYESVEIYTNLGIPIYLEDLPFGYQLRKIPEHILKKYGL